MDKSSLKQSVAAAIIFLCVIAALFSPVLFRRHILLPTDQLNTMILPYSYEKPIHVHNHFLNDAITQYYIYKHLTKSAIENNRLVYWNPFICGGFPQYALTMAGNFDVTNLLLPLMKGDHAAYVLQLLMTFFISGISMYLLIRYYGHCFMTAVIIGIAYMLNSMFITTSFHRWILASFCWMPLVLLFLDKSLSKPGTINYLIGGVFLAAAFMASSMQTASFVLFVIFIYGAVFWWRNSRDFKSCIRVLKICALISIMGAGLSMIMWFPTGELFYIDSVKSGSWQSIGSSGEPFSSRIAGLPLLISFMMPELAGGVRAFDLTKIANATMAHFNGYIGFLPLVFSVFALSSRSIKKITPYYIGCALAGLGLLIPVATPLLRYVYHRFFIVYILGMCILSASGISIYLNTKDRKQFLRPLKWITFIWLFVFLCVLTLQAAFMAFYPQISAYARKYVESHMYMANLIAGNRQWYLDRAYALLDHFRITSPSMFIPVIGIWSCLLLIYAHIKDRISKRVFLLFFVLLTAAQLIIFARNFLPMPEADKYPLYPKIDIADILKRDKSIFRVYVLNTDSEAHPILSPNILTMYGIETINGYESVEPRMVNSLLTSMKAEDLGAINIKYLVTHEKNDLALQDFEPVYSGSGIKLFRNNLSMPRAFMVYDYEIKPDRDFLAEIKGRGLDIKRKVFFNEKPPYELDTDNALAPGNNVSITKYASERIEIKAVSNKNGYLVVSNTYYPGWECSIDGKNTQLLKANAVMWAVFIPAGSHDLVFSFRPEVFFTGMRISIATAIFMFLLFISSLIKRRYYA